MKKLIFISAFLFFSGIVMSTTYTVDLNGGGQFTKIQDGIVNAAYGDTVKVWPGTYMEQVNLNKEIVLMGSGYENTIITGTFDPSVTLTSGTLMWFMISSLSGTGIVINGGIVKNCVIRGCLENGIHCISGGGNIINCTILNNGSAGVMNDPANGVTLYVTNCISRSNGSYGFQDGFGVGTIQLSYSNGSGIYTTGNQGCFDQDPLFTSNNDFHISQGSPCWNTGHPSISDPDGSASDMGYFGGPDCPIYPVVYEITIAPSGNNIDIQAKGRANY